MKERFDKKFPEVKMLRERELRRASWKLFGDSAISKVVHVIYPIIALVGIFVYWIFFEINVFLSILFGIVTWFVVTYIFDIFFLKILGIEKAVKKANDEEIETAGKQFEETLGESMDNFLK